MEQLVIWCRDKNLCLTVNKTKQLIIDFRGKKLYSDTSAVEKGHLHFGNEEDTVVCGNNG